jgi:hypothetical protein
MNVIKNSQPWKHLVIDNFLSDSEYQQVKEYVDPVYNRLNNKKGYKELHRYNSNTLITKIFVPKILLLKDKFFNDLNYAGKLLPSDTYPYIELVICPSGYRYEHIHSDTEYKLMSTVLFFHPKDGDGTELYTEKNPDKMHSQVEWKPNRALTFVSQNNPNFQRTWHNYGNTKTFPRVSFNLILSSTPDGKQY